MSFNKQKVFAVFNDADNQSASLAARLLEQGIASRADARPLCIEWAAAKYKVAAVKGQRGLTLPRNSAAEQAVKRVLAACFPAADQPKAARKTANKVDAVAKLLKAYNDLSSAERRRFRASL